MSSSFLSRSWVVLSRRKAQSSMKVLMSSSFLVISARSSWNSALDDSGNE